MDRNVQSNVFVKCKRCAGLAKFGSHGIPAPPVLGAESNNKEVGVRQRIA